MSAYGTSNTAWDLMTKEEYSKYKEKKEEFLNKIFDSTDDIKLIEIMSQITNFSSSKEAWEKLELLKKNFN